MTLTTNRPLVLCVALLAACTVDAAAEPIVFGTAQLSTFGVFSCRPEPVCSASGNTVTLGSGDAAVTLSFRGVTTSVPLANYASSVVLGTLIASSTGATAFPTRTNTLLPIVSLRITLAQSSPVADTASHLWGFGPGGGAPFLPLLAGSAYFTLDPGPVPPGYGELIYTIEPESVAFGLNHEIALVGQVGVTPEPATMALVAIGLAGVVRRVRHQRLNSERSKAP